MLSPREIIAQAWAITTTTRPLKYWGFFGSFFEILLDSKLVLTQAYFAYSYFQGSEAGFFDIEIMLYNAVSPLVFWLIMVAFILLLMIEVFVPSLSSGAIIGLAAKAHAKEEVKGGVILALYNFFPILAVHEVFVFTSFSVLITAMSLILRYGGNMSGLILTVTMIVWIVSNIVKFFSSFTEPAIVVEKLGVFAAGAKSVKLMMSYMPHVTFLFMLLAIISVRIFINTMIILLVPSILMGIGLVLVQYVSLSITIIISTIIGVIVTLVAAYFFAYLHVFKQAVWTIMYMELIQEKELDIIR
jgi:hypothetical protein